MNTREPKMISNLDELLDHASAVGPRTIVVVGAGNQTAASAATEAEKLGLAKAILIGSAGEAASVLAEIGVGGTSARRVIDNRDEGDCVHTAVRLVRSGEADILLKGSVDTATLMKAVLDSSDGLRTGGLMSDVLLCELREPAGTRLLLITDGGVTPHPDLGQKIEIIRNAVNVAQALGIERSRVALLSATEKVTAAVPSTLDAAIITQMNRRGQIAGCVIDGPLSLDLAVSEESARVKGIESAVAGRADILVAPTMEVANILAKGITHYGGFRLAHVIVGGRVPILIPSRSDSVEAKLFSIALGVVMCCRPSEPETHVVGKRNG